MSSDELRDALNRRLKKIDSGGSREISVDATSPAGVRLRSPENKDGHNTFRSGWTSTPPIARSTLLPPAQLNPGSPTRSEASKVKVCVFVLSVMHV